MSGKGSFGAAASIDLVDVFASKVAAANSGPVVRGPVPGFDQELSL